MCEDTTIPPETLVEHAGTNSFDPGWSDFWWVNLVSYFIWGWDWSERKQVDAQQMKGFGDHWGSNSAVNQFLEI